MDLLPVFVIAGGLVLLPMIVDIYISVKRG